MKGENPLTLNETPFRKTFYHLVFERIFLVVVFVFISHFGQGHQGAREGAVRAHIMRQFKFLLQHSPETNISQLPYSQLLTQEAMISPITIPCVGNASVGT
ncbi:hypothetical protein GQ457_16G015820 [Hibiscus cannabinus]